jgi:hypothetical protein
MIRTSVTTCSWFIPRVFQTNNPLAPPPGEVLPQCHLIPLHERERNLDFAYDGILRFLPEFTLRHPKGSNDKNTLSHDCDTASAGRRELVYPVL